MSGIDLAFWYIGAGISLSAGVGSVAFAAWWSFDLVARITGMAAYLIATVREAERIKREHGEQNGAQNGEG